MKRLMIVLGVLLVFSVSALAQMEGQKGEMGKGMMEQKSQMTEQKGMMEKCQIMMKQDMMQMMMDMMNMQEKMMMAPNADEKKQMMKDMSQMKEKMQKIMSMHMGAMMRQSVYDLQAKLKCAEQWLKKAIDLHEIHIKDPKTATEASQMEMMEQMENAYKCITTGLETTETPAKVHEGEKTKREDFPKTEQHKHSH
ncbi:MAG: hypothetical protein HY752_04080 [Nitrospirae bacterium]|nr:hypothetical protein [Nitrospirota bacterium]